MYDNDFSGKLMHALCSLPMPLTGARTSVALPAGTLPSDLLDQWDSITHVQLSSCGLSGTRLIDTSSLLLDHGALHLCLSPGSAVARRRRLHTPHEPLRSMLHQYRPHNTERCRNAPSQLEEPDSDAD